MFFRTDKPSSLSRSTNAFSQQSALTALFKLLLRFTFISLKQLVNISSMGKQPFLLQNQCEFIKLWDFKPATIKSYSTTQLYVTAFKMSIYRKGIYFSDIYGKKDPQLTNFTTNNSGQSQSERLYATLSWHNLHHSTDL